MNKLFMFILVSFMSLSVVNADLTTDNLVYYSFDNDDLTGVDPIDLSGNGNNGDNFGATTGVTGVLNQGFDFVRANEDYVTYGSRSGNTDFSISVWYYLDTATPNQYMIYEDGNVRMRVNPSGQAMLLWDNRGGSGNFRYTDTYTANVNTWTHLVLAVDGNTNYNIYENGILLSSIKGTTGSATGSTTAHIGSASSTTGLGFSGKLDEFAFYSKTLSLSEVQELYNSGTGYNPYDTTSAIITFNNPTNNDFLNDTSFLLNVSFSEITNSTYQLNGGTSTTLGTDTDQETTTLTGVEGFNTLTVFTDTKGELSDNSINFTIDTIDPIITNNLPSEINTYSIDFSEYITITDTNPYTCVLEVVGQENTTCDNNNFIFNENGNQTINIYVEDSAGNIANSLNNIILINPTISIQLRDTITDSLISNYMLGDYNVLSNTLNINVYDLGIGTHTFEFIKEGYVIENLSFTFTLTSEGIITLYASQVTLFARVYDGETLEQITNFDVQIKNLTDVLTFTGLNNLSKLYDQIPSGEIEITFSASNYSNGLFYTEFEPFTALIFDVYLTPLNLSSIITFTLTDINTRQFLDGVSVEARRSIINETISVQQTKTTSTGIAYFVLDELKDYEFVFTKDGYTQAIINSIPSVTNYNIRLNPEAQNYVFLNGVNARFFPQTGQLYQNTSYNFTTQITGSAITRLEYKLFTNDGILIDSFNTTNPTGSTFNTEFFIPEGYNQSEITSEVKVFINGNTFTHSNKWRIGSVLEGTLKDLKDFGQSTDEEFKLLKFFIVIISYVIVIIIGNRNPITRDFVSMLALLPTVIFTYLGWIPLLYGTVITIALFVLYLGGNKRG